MKEYYYRNIEAEIDAKEQQKTIAILGSKPKEKIALSPNAKVKDTSKDVSKNKKQAIKWKQKTI